jgi:hypothetical protein
MFRAHQPNGPSGNQCYDILKFMHIHVNKVDNHLVPGGTQETS